MLEEVEQSGSPTHQRDGELEGLCPISAIPHAGDIIRRCHVFPARRDSTRDRSLSARAIRRRDGVRHPRRFPTLPDDKGGVPDRQPAFPVFRTRRGLSDRCSSCSAPRLRHFRTSSRFDQNLPARCPVEHGRPCPVCADRVRRHHGGWLRHCPDCRGCLSWRYSASIDSSEKRVNSAPSGAAGIIKSRSTLHILRRA